MRLSRHSPTTSLKIFILGSSLTEASHSSLHLTANSSSQTNSDQIHSNLARLDSFTLLPRTKSIRLPKTLFIHLPKLQLVRLNKFQLTILPKAKIILLHKPRTILLLKTLLTLLSRTQAVLQLKGQISIKISLPTLLNQYSTNLILLNLLNLLSQQEFSLTLAAKTKASRMEVSRCPTLAPSRLSTRQPPSRLDTKLELIPSTLLSLVIPSLQLQTKDSNGPQTTRG